MTIRTAFDNFIAFWDRVGQSRSPTFYVGNSWIELTIIAALFMLVVLLFIKHTGLCILLRSARQGLLAAAYEILLYRRSPRAVVSAETRLVWNNLKFLFFLIPSLIVAGVVFAAMFDTLSNRYGYAPAPVGRNVVVRAEYVDCTDRTLADCKITTHDEDDLAVTACVTVPSKRILWTRLKAKRAGMFVLKTYGRPDAGAVLNVASPNRPALRRQYIDGAEIDIAYPQATWKGWKYAWLAYLCVMCVVLGVPLGRWLRVPL